MRSDAFRAAAEAKDLLAAEDLFAEDVTFRSPVVYKPYEGREPIKVLLGAVVQVFEDFRYLEQVETGDTAVLMFEARVGDKRAAGGRHPQVRRRRPDRRDDRDGPADERHARARRGDAQAARGGRSRRGFVKRAGLAPATCSSCR